MTDHKAGAERLTKLAGEIDSDAAATSAVAHATLYLAEQQRIANVLLYHSTAAQIDFNQLDEEAKKKIREGLGI